MEKSVPSAKKKFSIRDIMTIAAMMVICFIIMMVMSSLTLPFPLVYLYGSAGIDGFICAVFFLVAANRVNKHGLLFAWAGIYGLIQGVMGYMFLFPYFLAVGLIAELSMLGKDTYRNPLRTRIGWTINCVGNFVGCAVPLWWAWDSYGVSSGILWTLPSAPCHTAGPHCTLQAADERDLLDRNRHRRGSPRCLLSYLELRLLRNRIKAIGADRRGCAGRN